MSYAVDHSLPHLIVKGRDTVLSTVVERDGFVSPVAGTARVYRDGGTQVGADYAIASTTTPSITILAATTGSEDLSEYWRVEWDFGDIQSTNSAHLVRRALAPVLTDRALYRRAPALDPARNPIHSQATFAAEREEAWIQISRRLINVGRRPWLVIEPDALREVHMLLTLALIFEAFAHRAEEAFAETADRYREQYRQAWNDLKFRYDESEDGTDAEPNRESGSALIWTMP